MKIEAVYLDMDGVLTDFVASSIKALGRDVFEILSRVIPGDYNGIYTALGMSEAEFWMRIDALEGGRAPGSGLWEAMKPYPWRDSILEACRKLGPTWILTAPSRNPGSSFGKVSWLQEWLGQSFRDYVLAPRKWHLARPRALLVDDHDENVEKWRERGGEAILFPRLWNSRYALAECALDVLLGDLEAFKPELYRSV